MPRIIGITGNIACGKTSVGQMLLELGAERYIDADAVVHKLYEAGQAIALEVARVFGPQVIDAQGAVERRALGEIVFNDPVALKQLESIVHPAVGAALAQELTSTSETGIVVIDAVKLLEGRSGAFCQSKWLIVCPEEQELARLIARNHYSEEEAWQRIRAQPSVKDKIALVDEVIDNGGTLESTRSQVVAAFERFCQKYPA